MDPCTWMSQWWPIRKNLFASVLCGHMMYIGRPAKSDGWQMEKSAPTVWLDDEEFFINSFWWNFIYIYIYIYIYMPIDIIVTVFANGPKDWGLFPGWAIPKTQKIVLYASLLNTQHYKFWIKSKWSNPENGVAQSSTPQCSSYWNKSLQVTLTMVSQLLRSSWEQLKNK